MEPTDEELLHGFYAGDSAGLEQLADRLEPVMARMVYLILQARTGSDSVSPDEWDIDERLTGVWGYVFGTRMTGLARWPHQRLTALTWLIHILCLEMDRHLGFVGPF